MSKTFSVRNLTYSGIFIALLCVSGVFNVPIANGAISLQLAVVFVLSCILDKKLAFLTVLAYIILGLAGLPVFAKGGGLGYILQPTFGFVISFIFSAFLLSLIYKSRIFKRKSIAYIVGVAVSLIVVYVLGSSYMYFVFKLTTENQFDFARIISFAVTPYLLPDIGKAIFAYFIVIALEKATLHNQPNPQ